MTVRYKLDTDMASFVIRGCSATLDARLRENDPSALSVSSVTRAELRYGVARRPDARSIAACGMRLLRVLQRGRAEIGHGKSESEKPVTLQRGRALARAEIRWVRVACGTLTSGFNGAAHLRARRCPQRASQWSLRALLQRGRALARAEIRRLPRERKERRLLQRGRALARAEISARRTGSHSIRRFNGAAHLRARRSHLVHSVPKARSKASTGPRTCARGDIVTIRQHASVPLASTGPRTCARGDCATPA